MTRPAAEHRYALFGLVYLLVGALLITLSVMAYRKQLPWQRAVDVRLVTTQPGLELNPGSDVKIQGRVIGRVQKVTSDGVRATVHLQLDRGDAHLVPAGVDAAIVPKTLFGEKYVDLLTPTHQASSGRIADGAVISQSTTAVELGRVFDRLVPLLRALEPQQLSLLINGLRQALDGRGEQIGRIIEQGDAFLGELGPHLDALHADLDLLGTTLRTYDDAAPDLLTTLDNTAAISDDLLVPQEQQLHRLLTTLVTTSDTGRRVLGRNAEAIIRLSGDVEPLLALLHTYAGELPCSLKGLALLDRLGNQVTGGRSPFTLLNIDMIVTGDPYVAPRDLPSTPGSDAHNGTLPLTVPDWSPHCPRFGTLARQVKDAAPFSLEPLKFQAVTSGIAPADPTATTVTDPRLARALAETIAREVGRPLKHTRRPLAGLLVGPLLYDDEVSLR